MKILIVDDETLALSRLRRMLEALGYSDITEADSAQAALKAADTQRFDLALLDINMPGGDGLELGFDLRYRQNDIAIIFQTAYDEHALKAFEVGAMGYLVKPYSKEQLKAVIERVETAAAVPNDDFRLLSKSGDTHYLFKPDEIFYVKADLTEVIFRTKEGFSYFNHKISEVEQLLSTYEFVRIHRSYLVNLNRIKSFETIEQSKLRFTFEGIGDTIDSSKDGAKLFRQRFSVK
jgi:two-component system LytT family response regulator